MNSVDQMKIEMENDHDFVMTSNRKMDGKAVFRCKRCSFLVSAYEPPSIVVSALSCSDRQIKSVLDE